jgi:hypothetical protein
LISILDLIALGGEIPFLLAHNGHRQNTHTSSSIDYLRTFARR